MRSPAAEGTFGPSTWSCRLGRLYSVLRNAIHGHMQAEKTVGMSFRVTPKTKRLLAAAAEHERRSLTNMLEVLVEDFCIRNGINERTANSSERVIKAGRTRK